MRHIKENKREKTMFKLFFLYLFSKRQEIQCLLWVIFSISIIGSKVTVIFPDRANSLYCQEINLANQPTGSSCIGEDLLPAGLPKLEGVALYAGQLLAPAEGFDLWLKLFFPVWQKRLIMLFWQISGHCWCWVVALITFTKKSNPPSFPILGLRNLPRALRHKLFSPTWSNNQSQLVGVVRYK